MKRGLLSFAVAFFAMLVLFYFASSAFSLSDYQSAGQTRLQLQVLSQKYSDATAYFDDAILDAIADSGYNSTESGSCASSASVFSTIAPVNVNTYLSRAQANLSAAFNNSEVLAIDFSAENASVTGAGSASVTSACVGGTLSMNTYYINASFPFNLTDSSRGTGYINRTFNKSYEVYVERSGAIFYILVQRAGVQLRCISVTGCT
jgi:hypothetical protein